MKKTLQTRDQKLKLNKATLKNLKSLTVGSGIKAGGFSCFVGCSSEQK